MTQQILTQEMDNNHIDPRWRDLYRIGGITCLVIPASIVIAILVYFIWPYTPGFTHLETIFTLLHTNRLEGLLTLDLVMVLMIPVMIIHILALYVVLKQENASYALIALVLGLIGSVLILTARPLSEMVYLSDQYASATREITKSQYLAAGEAFHALFGGTAWLWWNILTGISYTISSFLMLKSDFFPKTTAYVGIVLFVLGSGFWLPGIGLVLSLLGTAGSVIWYLLQVRPFFQLTAGASQALHAS